MWQLNYIWFVCFVRQIVTQIIWRRGWSPKFATGLNTYHIRHSSKSIRVTKLSYCQSDYPMSESFWQNNSLVTHIFFDLCLFKHFSPVANFGQQMGSNNRFLNNYPSNHSRMFFEPLGVETKYQWINEFLDTILNSQQNYLVIAF